MTASQVHQPCGRCSARWRLTEVAPENVRHLRAALRCPSNESLQRNECRDGRTASNIATGRGAP
jgi:hypothetical protein